MNDKEYDLEYCPFCGSYGVIKDNNNGSYWGACTNNECLCTLGCEKTIEEAIERWNYREY